MPPRNLTSRELSNIKAVKRNVAKRLRKYEAQTVKRGDLLLQSAANDTANMAKHMGNYTDRTGNLRNSIFTNVEFLKANFETLPEGPGGKKMMPNDLRPSRPSIKVESGDRIAVVGAGMIYGKHVQNREGYDVLVGAYNWIRATFAKYFKAGLHAPH